MQKKHEPPLQLELKPSKQLKRLLVVMHVLAMGASFANALPLAVKLVLLSGLIIHLAYMFRHLSDRVCKIKQTEAFGWELADSNDFEAIQILESTVITTFAIFLHFIKNTHKCSLLIVNDALTEDEYRRFIVRLKTAGIK